MEVITTISYIILPIFCLVIIFLNPFVRRLQATTLWVGKKLVDPELRNSGVVSSRGLQDAITPRFQDKLNLLVSISAPVLVVVSGTIIIFYLGIISLLICYFLTSITDKLWSNKLNYYFNLIISDMERRVADYARDNDQMRVEAAKEISGDLKKLFFQYINLDLDVPSIIEAKKM